MDGTLFGAGSIATILIYSAAVLATLALVSVIRKIFRKPKANPHAQFASCASCGWQGQVSKYAGRCPNCNAPLGAQIVRKRAK